MVLYIMAESWVTRALLGGISTVLMRVYKILDANLTYIVLRIESRQLIMPPGPRPTPTPQILVIPQTVIVLTPHPRGEGNKF